MDGGDSPSPKFSDENENLDDAASEINGYSFPLSYIYMFNIYFIRTRSSSGRFVSALSSFLFVSRLW
ncbi:unnamed protein product [Brassica rapa subsp. narinosa]